MNKQIHSIKIMRLLTVLAALGVLAFFYGSAVASSGQDAKAATPGKEIIAQGQAAESQVVEKKMNKDLQRGDEGFWSYALSTLIIRFVGIFIVLGILQVVMQLSGKFFRHLEEKAKEKAKQSA